MFKKSSFVDKVHSDAVYFFRKSCRYSCVRDTRWKADVSCQPCIHAVTISSSTVKLTS